MNEFLSGLLVTVGGFVVFISLMFGMLWHDNKKVVLSALFATVLSVALMLNPLWGSWYLFFKNFAATVPVWIWVLVGITIYFTLNHIYAAWVVYANTWPYGLAAKILFPWPLGTLTPAPPADFLLGSLYFTVWWLVAVISYAAWLIFGGGIAKLLHLVPREPRP